MIRITLLPITIAALFMLEGCSLFGADPAERILGKWQYQVAGLPVVVEYDEKTVRVGNNPPVGYMLDGDRLTFAMGEDQVRIVSFPSRDEMVQEDPVTGTVQRFRRLY